MWNRCDQCGRFISHLDFLKGKATRRMITPSSILTVEEWETLCARCKNNNYEEFGGEMNRKRIKIKMLEKELNGRQLARLTAINYTTLTQIVTGRVNPTEDEKIAISKALDTPQSKLFKGE